MIWWLISFFLFWTLTCLIYDYIIVVRYSLSGVAVTLVTDESYISFSFSFYLVSHINIIKTYSLSLDPIKERPDIGVYVKDLSNVTVSSADHMERIMQYGNNYRYVIVFRTNEKW